MNALAQKPLPHRKWAHEPLICVSRDVVKVYCRCGWQSKRDHDDAGSAMAEHEEHVGLKKIQALKERFDNR